MKKIILTLVVYTIALNLFSQTYKLESVYPDRNAETYLSYMKVIDDSVNSEANNFVLWGYQFYNESWLYAYEVEYFKGEAKDLFIFLTEIIEFTKKYKNEDSVLTFIKGVKVKTLNKMGFKYTLVYDKEFKVMCKFNQNQWEEMLEKFKLVCENKGILYK